MSRLRKKIALASVTVFSIAVAAGVAAFVFSEIPEEKETDMVYVRTFSAEEFDQLYGHVEKMASPHVTYSLVSAEQFDRSKYSQSEIVKDIEDTTKKTKVIIENDGDIYIKE
ncbi:hypothetical protein ACP26L_06760 [Paenibacillus sp. S-38]|uniref:hypothetical protein n=1 Tax=Paenibacillus sp. S-38 TaxID=3416710 RepID=UPI003CE86196